VLCNNHFLWQFYSGQILLFILNFQTLNCFLLKILSLVLISQFFHKPQTLLAAFNICSSNRNIISFSNSYPLAIIYDRNWLARYVNTTESVNAIRRVIANAQLIFNWPSLTIPIQLQVVSITFQNINIPADGSGL
jgi:hypothetical protein